jgi:hypothetical protein
LIGRTVVYLTVPGMKPRPRNLALVAVVVPTLAALVACGASKPVSAPTAGASATATSGAAATTPPGAPPPTTAGGASAPPASSYPALSGTGYFLGVGSTDGGLYTLSHGTLTKVITDTSYEFFATAAVAPNGSFVASVTSASKVKVQPFGGAAHTLAPTIQATRILQISPDNDGILVPTDQTHVATLSATSGALTAYATAKSGYYFGVFGPDLSDCIELGMGTSTILDTDPMDTSHATTAIAPSGQYYYRVQSVLGYFDHFAVVMLKPNGTPAGDAGRVTGANALVNLRTGEILATPGGGQITGGFYLNDQTVILRETIGGVDSIINAGPNGHVAAGLTLPPSVANLSLIAWTK